MQHQLKLCIEYTNTVNPQPVTEIDYLDQPIYSFNKIIKWKYSEFAFLKNFALFEPLQIEKELLIANGHLVTGKGLDEILGDIYIYIDTAGLRTATVDVNNIKPCYSVQLPIVLI